MKKTAPKQPNKKDLLRVLNENLSAIERTDAVLSMHDGREYVCSVCHMPVKPCETQPGAVCNHMLREATDTALIEGALLHPEERRLGVCASCGKRMTPAQIRKNPTADLCPECLRKERRVRSDADRA